MGKSLIFIVLVMSVGCRRFERKPDVFDARQFILSALQSSTSNSDLGLLAAKTGSRPETRELGAAMHREQSQLRSDLLQLAQRRNIQAPATLEEKRVALKENLSLLRRDLFDQGYALAMVQDLRSMAQSLDAAASSSDADVRALANQYRGVIAREQQMANALFKLAGGSPWGIPP